MKKINVIIVDDHSVVRMGLSTIINLEKDLHVCAEAENGMEAVRQAAEHKPDVVIIDLAMPGMDGVETTKAVLEASPTSHVLILTSFGTSRDIAHALEVGATGAITKNLSNADLAQAIRRTAAGERTLSPEIEGALREQEDDESLQFTRRESDVLNSITRGLTNREIATLLGISNSRVKQHLKAIFDRLGATNRAEAVSIAMRKLNPR